MERLSILSKSEKEILQQKGLNLWKDGTVIEYADIKKSGKLDK